MLWQIVYSTFFSYAVDVSMHYQFFLTTEEPNIILYNCKIQNLIHNIKTTQ